ncbi:DUF6449 domain-containing protein [Bacillus marasmi]|uniref:DUF6449 domain-containing protein n=1 Tax=Bacillus marasmi TaxID=1926279 RepID=UPI0011C9C8F4|nr:DUF6449 domain-containing protein [Bacillus marasmi]
MQSKTSWFNKELFLHILRNVGWVSIVYFLGLLISLPIRIMMTYSEEKIGPFVDNLFQYDFQIQATLLIATPVLMAVFLFRFLHVKQAADLIHSLPMRREKIFHHYCLSGAVLLIIPVVLIAIILYITHAVMDLGLYFNSNDILYWAGVTILFNLVLMMSSVFVAIMTGISAVSAVLSYIFMVFPVGMTLLIFYNLRMALYGFPGDYLLNNDLQKYSPLTFAITLETRPIKWEYALLFGVLTIVLYGLSLVFYKIRKVEAAQEAIAFANLRAIFKYGVTFCMMLFGGVYFSEVQNTGFGWVVFGYSLGAFVGYFVAEMVLQKTWRVLGGVKGFAIYGMVIVAVFTTVNSLGFYEKKQPTFNEIENVYMSGDPFILSDTTDVYEHMFVPEAMKSEINKKEVLKLHKQIIADKEINQKLEEGQYETAFFKYTLTDGSTIVRQYRVNRELYKDSYRKIYESEEYKRATNEIFHIDIKKIKSMSITSPFGNKQNLIISDPVDIRTAIDALKEDILLESYDDQQYFGGYGSGIELFIGKDRSSYLMFKPNYHQFSNWLKERGLLEKATVNSQDIDKIVMANINTGDFIDVNEVAKYVESSTKTMTITKKDQIDLCLNQAGTMSKHEYAAITYFKNGSTDILFFDKAHVPDFVKEHFN